MLSYKHKKPATAPVLNLENIVVRYGDHQVLDNISLEIHSGETIALLGPNGAGKSTLIEVAAGLRRPSGGIVTLGGEDPINASASLRSEIGLMLQNWKDHGKWTVREFLSYVSVSFLGRATNSQDLVEALGLTESANTKLSSLSGGQRRRVDVAAALLGRPSILILDEPTTGFGVHSKISFQNVVRELSADITVLWATHDLVEAESVADRLILLSSGVIAASGSVDELRRIHGGTSKVSWRTQQDGSPHSVEVDDPKPLLVELASDPGTENIEVKTTSLEDLYLSITQESGDVDV